MSWIEVSEYLSSGWADGVNIPSRARHYCAELEKGQILFFRQPPFVLPEDDVNFLVSQKASDSRLHKNISYRPGKDLLRGFSDGKENQQRVHRIMRDYSSQVTQFVSRFLAPYAGKLLMDFASFRPLEEDGRNLPLHKKNDLVHVDAFPSRPTRGGRILRVFTNVNPSKGRVWFVTDRFPALAKQFATDAGLKSIAVDGASNLAGRLTHALHAIGLPVTDRSPYDKFMLRFHDFLKENTAFQTGCEKERLEFPPMATWLVYTDGVPHAALSGQFAMEQTFIMPVEALVALEHAPIRVLEGIYGKKLA
ncbi:MAG: hypothetical protein DMG74_13025 [Acidobacteria bacterium]|nr:MAG: hypothetical protein DMG74_13025 [Acidobacteriota bacterium]